MNKHEVKFANTAKRIQSALIDLLETKNFADIAISDICKKANINRSTFYAHYENTIELLADLEESLIQQFIKENAELVDRKVVDEANKPKFNALTSNEVLIPYLSFVKRNRQLFNIYNKTAAFGKSEHKQMLKELIFTPAFSANGITDTVVSDYLFAYYINGINAIINKWVYDECKIAIETICEIIRLCILNILNMQKPS